MKNKKITVAAAIAVPTLTLATGSIPFEAIADVEPLIKSETNRIKPTAKDAQTIASVTDANLKRVIKDVLGISQNADLTVADMYGLTELSLMDTSIEITSLAGLEQAVNLSSFSLFNQEHLDLTPLHSLTNLKSLSLIGRELTSISELMPFVGVESLTLEGAGLVDITELSVFTQLKHLDLSGNQIEDILPLAGLTSLETLNLSNNSILTLPGLSGLTQLKSLDLSVNGISDITTVNSLTSLEKLNIRDTKVSSLEPVKSLISLKEIIFNSTKVIDINPLASLTQLEKVVGGENYINDFRPVSHVANISFNEIYLQKTMDLTSLYISLPIYLPSGERMPLTSTSGIWDEQKQAFKLTEVPIDGDKIVLYFNENETIKGTVELTVNIEEVEAPVILTNQTTGEVTIKNIKEGNTVYYRDKQEGAWKEYTGSFKPSIVSQSGNEGYYYIEAKQTNGLVESEVVVTEFSRELGLTEVKSEFNWWQNGKATMTLTHENMDAKIYYRLEDRDWKEYRKELDLSSEYKKGKIEMQFYAVLPEGQTEVSNFSILKTPEITGVKNDDKVQITHPLPKVNIYYRVNGGEWMFYDEAFGFSEEGEYLIETYAEEAGVESPVSLPVTVKTYSSDAPTNNEGNGSNTNTGTGSNQNQNTNTNQNQNTNTDTNTNQNANQNQNSNTSTGTNTNVNQNTNTNANQNVNTNTDVNTNQDETQNTNTNTNQSTSTNGNTNTENNEPNLENSETTNQEMGEGIDDENPVTGVSALAVLAGFGLMAAGAMILLENENRRKARV